MAQHTPGPWHVGDDKRAMIVYDSSGYAIANAITYHSTRTPGAAEANARLIAAAPPLLAAAKLALHHVIAGLSAGTPPEPQMLKRAHQALFEAISAADPSEYGKSHAERAAAEQ